MRESEKALLKTIEYLGENLSGTLILGSGNLSVAGTAFDTPYKEDYDLALKSGAKPLKEDFPQKFPKIIVIGTKQKEETAGMIVEALNQAEPEALLMVALENDSGGKALHKVFEKLDLSFDHYAKQKSQVLWTRMTGQANSKEKDIIKNAASRYCRADGLCTVAGVFSFEKIDKGTTRFIDFLNKSGADFLHGTGADFGCGIGDLSKTVLNHQSKVKKLYAIDHDRRAAECARINLEKYGTRTEALWLDIENDKLPRDLDFVVMNPPFHTGKAEEISLGKSFISRASECLRSKGVLYMVANVHLPYEEILKKSFAEIKVLDQGNGFKIIRAIKG